MDEKSGVRQKKIINLGLFAISLVPIFLYLFVMVQRISLPFDLEWGEGAGINQIYRHLSGGQIYGAPTLEYAPLVYTPFYYWLSSLIAGLNIPVTFAARLISVISSFGVAGILIWLVIQNTKDNIAGWLAGALYLACFALSDGYYDLVRVDSIYVFSLLISLYLLLKTKSGFGKLSAGLAIALGFFIKQSALLVFIPVLIYLIVRDWKSYLPILLTAVLGVMVPYLWLNSQTHGWFNYYILRLPGEHGYSFVSAVNFWVGDFLGPLGIAIGFGLVYLLFQRKVIFRENETNNEPVSDHGGSPGDAPIIFLFVLGAIGTAWITRSSNGGGANNAMVAYAAASLLFGLGFSTTGKLLKQEGEQKYSIIAASLVIIQFIGLIYNPFNYIPTKPEVAANNDLVEYLATIPGNALIPYRSHLPHLAGKETSIHAVNLFEMTGYFRGDVLPEGILLVNQIRENICHQNYGVIIMDQPIPWIDEQLKAAYDLDGEFDYLQSERRSPLLEWQGGFNSLYTPKQEIDLINCLASITSEEVE